jgi:hypothetical protein
LTAEAAKHFHRISSTNSKSETTNIRRVHSPSSSAVQHDKRESLAQLDGKTQTAAPKIAEFKDLQAFEQYLSGSPQGNTKQSKPKDTSTKHYSSRVNKSRNPTNK